MNDLIGRLQELRLLSSDAKAKSLVLIGSIEGECAILVAEKTAFNKDDLQAIVKPSEARLDVANNIYHKFFVTLASDVNNSPSAKYSLIYPATETHIKKYSSQSRRMMKETPTLYRNVVEPYIRSMIGDRIRWVYNILDHKSETDRILFEDRDEHSGFILLPDLKWDGTTLSALYILCLVQRRDLRSIRDLKGEHISFLKHLRDQTLTVMCDKFEIEKDQLRLYVHYQPSYYHLHVHVQTCEFEAGEGLAAGKAMLLDDIIECLENDSDHFQKRTFYYTIGVESDLYRLLIAP